MSTTFTLEPGYAYGAANIPSPADFLIAARDVTIDALRAKCIEYGMQEMVDETGSTMEDYINRYRVIPSDDLTIKAVENCLLSAASGGGRSREMKEIIRRAFMILALDECYKRNLAVSLIIS